MPQFAANLSMMFTERPFLERFAAAAEAGFTLSLIHISEPTRRLRGSRMPSSA